jgi:PST family polysaccharide transporter
MILARLLAPEAFGLMAIILAVNAALESFTQVGIKEAIIQYPNAENDTYLNGAWWFSFGRAIGLFILGVVGSIWIADFYNISKDLGILQLSFLAIVFNGALSARAYIALKKLEYKKWVLISHGGGICGIVTSVILSFISKMYWLCCRFHRRSGWVRILSFILSFIPRSFERTLNSIYKACLAC